jgi:hypothetical protein
MNAHAGMIDSQLVASTNASRKMYIMNEMAPNFPSLWAIYAFNVQEIRAVEIAGCAIFCGFPL